MTTQDLTALTSLLCHLVTYEYEIIAALEAADQESANYLDFRHDLAYAIAQATQPTQDQETAAQPEDHEPELYVTNAQWQATQDQETTTND